MGEIKTSPGPAADRAFRLGLVASMAAGAILIGALYWTGIISLLVVAYAVVGVLPVYLILVASLLSVWLGFDKDTSALRRVRREQESRYGE